MHNLPDSKDFADLAQIASGTCAALALRMARARNCTDLEVWQLCDPFRRLVREILKRPAFRRDGTLQDQLNRSAEDGLPAACQRVFLLLAS